MNSLDKRTHLTTSGLALMPIPFFFACDVPTALEIELNANKKTLQGNKVEFILPSSSIYIDSLRTDATALSLFGQSEDSVFGKITAVSHSRYFFPLGESTDYDSSTIFSSASITLLVEDLLSDGIVSGDQISIHEALDTIYSNPVYLSNRVTAYNPEPIGSTTFDFDVATDTTIEIPLNDLFGKFLSDGLICAALYTSRISPDSLAGSPHYYPALAFVPQPTKKGLLTFDLSSTVTRLSVKMDTLDTLGIVHPAYETDFTFSQTGHYSRIIRDKNRAKRSDLTNDYDESNVPSTNVYLNMIAGVYPNIDLSPFQEFIEGGEQFIINKATLSFNTETGYQNSNSAITGFFIKENGRINPSAGSRFNNWFTTGLMGDIFYLEGLSQSTPFLFNLYETDQVYSSSVTFFAQTMSDFYQSTGEHLTTEVAFFGSSAIDLKKTTFPKSDIKLTIFYTTAKN